MKTVINFLLLLVFMGFAMPYQSDAQIIKKSKNLLNKARGVLIDEAEKKAGEDQTKDEQTSSEDPSAPGQKNKGKKLSPPDVIQHLTNARPSLDSKNYSSARFDIQQALVGIELQLGQKVLDEMPKDVNGMTCDPEADELTSQGMGFVGLVIGREYANNDRNMRASIINNSVMASMYGSALTTSNSEYKAVNVQGHRGAIHFDGDNKYELGVPLGQATLFMLDCSDFTDENEVLSAAGKFNLQQMMTILGEQ